MNSKMFSSGWFISIEKTKKKYHWTSTHHIRFGLLFFAGNLYSHLVRLGLYVVKVKCKFWNVRTNDNQWFRATIVAPWDHGFEGKQAVDCHAACESVIHHHVS